MRLGGGGPIPEARSVVQGIPNRSFLSQMAVRLMIHGFRCRR